MRWSCSSARVLANVKVAIAWLCLMSCVMRKDSTFANGLLGFPNPSLLTNIDVDKVEPSSNKHKKHQSPRPGSDFRVRSPEAGIFPLVQREDLLQKIRSRFRSYGLSVIIGFGKIKAPWALKKYYSVCQGCQCQQNCMSYLFGRGESVIYWKLLATRYTSILTESKI